MLSRPYLGRTPHSLERECCLKGQRPSTAAADTAHKPCPEEPRRTWMNRGTTGSEIHKATIWSTPTWAPGKKQLWAVHKLTRSADQTSAQQRGGRLYNKSWLPVTDPGEAAPGAEAL